MKINKMFAAVALSLSFCFINSVNAHATNLPTNENSIINHSKSIEEIKNLPNFDKASTSEIIDYLNNKEKDKKDNSLLVSENNFGIEYQERLDLARKIKMLKKANDLDNKKIINQSIDILNSDNKEEIKNQSKKLSDILSLYDVKIDDRKDLDLGLSSLEEIEIEESLKNYLNKGILFDNDLEDKNLKSFEKAILNSKSYELADDKTKDKYNEVIYDVKNKNLNNKEIFTILEDFVNSEDKQNFQGHLFQKDEIHENTKFNSSNESNIRPVSEDEVVETTTIDSQNPESENTNKESDSAFLKNEKIKDKFQELSDDQKRELDIIDTDKNGQISDSELDSSANFSSKLDKTSWLYPFTDKALSNDSSKDQTSEGQVENESTSSAHSNQESTNTENSQTPKTVTIDNNSSKAPSIAPANEQKEDEISKKEEKFKESEAQAEKSSNTNAASIVQTGIQGLGIVIVVLIVAIIAYIIMKKNSKDMRK